MSTILPDWMFIRFVERWIVQNGEGACWKRTIFPAFRNKTIQLHLLKARCVSLFKIVTLFECRSFFSLCSRTERGTTFSFFFGPPTIGFGWTSFILFLTHFIHNKIHTSPTHPKKEKPQSWVQLETTMTSIIADERKVPLILPENPTTIATTTAIAPSKSSRGDGGGVPSLSLLDTSTSSASSSTSSSPTSAPPQPPPPPPDATAMSTELPPPDVSAMTSNSSVSSSDRTPTTTGDDSYSGSMIELPSSPQEKNHPKQLSTEVVPASSSSSSSSSWNTPTPITPTTTTPTETRVVDSSFQSSSSPSVVTTTGIMDTPIRPITTTPTPSTPTTTRVVDTSFPSSSSSVLVMDGTVATMTTNTTTPQLQEMRACIVEMEERMAEQNRQLQSLMKQQCQQMNILMETLQEDEDGASRESSSRSPPPLPICCGSYDYCHGPTKWNIAGYSSTIPDPEYDYFPGLMTGPMVAGRQGAVAQYSKPSSSSPSSSSSSSQSSSREQPLLGGGTTTTTSPPHHRPSPPFSSSSPQSLDSSHNKVISAIIPCYNEEGSDLDRTIRGLSRQIMPPGWRVEIVIVMDGVEQMSDSMARYLAGMFGISLRKGGDEGSNGGSGASGDQEMLPTMNPFEQFPDSQTIIVHPSVEGDEDEDHSSYQESLVSATATVGHSPPTRSTTTATTARSTRFPAMEGTVGGYSLVVKRCNRRKANSQMWWLGPHATKIQCRYALATDCGTYFERLTTARLMNRMDVECNTHAVTGFQRTMPSPLQGDGNFELCLDPFSHLLRQLQRFEFEVDHVSFMSVYDTLGAMHVIPGPCGLFRYSKLGSLKEGLMHDYFQLFTRSNRGLILGNVELVEDRIPGTLLAFPPKSSSKQAAIKPPEGWPRTGFVANAIFYMEAEKPLSQLVKQRRRWLNGTFATYLWMLREGIITNSNQDLFTRWMSWTLVVLSVLQGFVVRLFGPALNTVWMYRFGLFLPDLLDDPARIFDSSISLLDVVAEPGRLSYGLLWGGIYHLLYIMFVVGHTPRAKPMQDEISIVRYTEPSRYINDTKSAYRSWIFLPVLWINVMVIGLYILNAVGIISTLGWEGTPLTVRVLIIFCGLPFIMAILDGIVRCNFRPLVSMLIAAPFSMPLMIWFTIWLPAYATTRLSDLTWGNRERDSIDESATALTRAQNGKRVAYSLIGFNTAVAVVVIICMQYEGSVFPIFVLTYTLVLSMAYAASFIDVGVRFFSCVGSDMDSESIIEEKAPAEDSYTMMDEEQQQQQQEHSVTGWRDICGRSPASPEGTASFETESAGSWNCCGSNSNTE